MDILRFTTAGSVDDGKSTLIGRLLYDTGNIKQDILQSVSDEKNKINLAHLTDGLRAEREQGITIDVAYKYFSTPKRKYIVTDAPGHFQYTRNLVTGASAVDAMIILIDAQNGITAQTRRHSLVASFLGIQHVVLAINKMDAMGYSEAVFATIKGDFLAIAEKLQLQQLTFIPISALQGDNVTSPSTNMGWYSGTTLLQYLEGCQPVKPLFDGARFSVQAVINTAGAGFENGLTGKMLSGNFSVGEAVTAYPGGATATITRIQHGYCEVQQATAGQHICIYLDGSLTIGRGCLLAGPQHPPKYGNLLETTVCWLNDAQPLQVGQPYILRISTHETLCKVTAIASVLDNDTLEPFASEAVKVNQFAKVSIETGNKVAYETFSSLPELGRGIIIDAVTLETLGAFTIAG
jgi:sulfate adenylyltransferase subunit 1